MKNELKLTQESGLVLAKTKKLMGLTSKLLSKDKPLSLRTATTGLSQALIAGRYRDEGDGTVTDITTDLQWQRVSVGQCWENDDCIGKATEYNWEQAFEAAGASKFAGYQDWRLPTIDELCSLVYCSSGKPRTWGVTKGEACKGDYQRPTIVTEAFPNVPVYIVWSSSPGADNLSFAWNVSFAYGGSNYSGRILNGSVRLVRSGQ